MMYDSVLPPASKTPTFVDVGADSPYRTAIGWAQENGIVSGYGADRFGANDSLTTAQALAILYRYAGSPTVSESGADWGNFPAWAKNAAVWAVQNGVIKENELKSDAVMSEYAFARAWQSIPKEQTEHVF